jgi:hypothetical protein
VGKAAGAILAIGAIALGGWIAGPAVLGFAAESVGFLVARTVVAMGIMSIGSSILGTNKSENVGAEGTRSSSILANEASGVAALPIVYGRRRIGSKRIYMNVSDNNQKLHLVMALAEGQINKIRKVYFNDQLVIDMIGGDQDPTLTTTTYMPLQAKTSGRSTTTTSGVSSDVVSTSDTRIVDKFRSYIRFEYRLGTTTQEAFSYLTGKFSDWASTAQGKGVALAYFELTYNRDVFTSVPNITYEVDGRLVEDVASPGDYYAVVSDASTTSTSSLSIAGSGAKTLVLAEDLDYAPSSGMRIEVLYNDTNFMGGTVTSYTPSTKTLVLDMDYSYGSGTYSSWKVYNYASLGADPASVIYDYLTNEIYGKGIDPANIDTDSFISVQNYCADTVPLNFQGDIQRIRRYVVNGALNPDDTIYNNIKKLLSGFNGYLVYSNGKYYLKVNRERTDEETTDSLVAFDESNIIGKYDLSLGTKATRFNQVKLTHFDKNQNYIANIIYYSNPTYLTQDNETVIERELDLPMVSDPRQATYIAAIALNQSRYSAAISFTASFAALRVEVGDIVRLSSRDLGFEDKLFRILSMGLNVDGTVKLDGVEYYDEVYTPGTLPEISVAAKTGRPADGNDSSNGASAVVAPPTNINASVGSVQQTDGTYLSKIDVSWTAPTTGGIANYEIVLTGTTNATYITSATSYTITGLPNGTYYVSVRSVNTYGSKSTLVDSLA